MSLLRRGFKSEANAIAREIRHELGLKLVDPLDPRLLAAHLEIPIVPLSEFRAAAPPAVSHFLTHDKSSFSAVTVFRGPARLIVFNDGHTDGRQASDLAHELSHGLLLHPPVRALDHRGCRDWDAEKEEEANWLAGALLISDEAAIAIAQAELSLDEAARKYGVSRPMVQFRLNVTGAKKRVRWGRSP